jgi:glucokinase
VFVDNDVNMMAFGEYCYGAGRHSRNLFCMTLGTGVGGAFIIDGAMYRGKSFSAGEVGHIPLNEKGPRCPCGGKACLERYVGNKEIARLAHAAYGKVLPANVRRALTQEKSSEITPRALARLAREGDAKARKLWFRIGGFIGLGLVTIVNLYNPDTIVIGGGVAGAGKFLFDPIRRTIAQRAMRLPGKVVSIKKAKLAEDAGIIGAAACAMNALRKKYMKRPS